MTTRPFPIAAQMNTLHLELVLGDITQQTTDAIVNAANSSLLGGGGVDGAIHRAAGPELLAATRKLNGCETGDAVITDGYNLKAKRVIHAVGPVYRRGDALVAELLRSAYYRCFELAAQNQLTSIALPAISTGVYGYPVDEAAPIALLTTLEFSATPSSVKRVRFVLYNDKIAQGFAAALDTLIRANSALVYLS
jgi:O-acetyl-ADP-ribose deacetylase